MRAPHDVSPAHRRYQSLDLSIETITAGVLAALIAVPSPFSVSLSLGGAASIALIPVTFPPLWHNSRGRLLLIAVLAFVPTGLLVAQISLLKDSSRTFSMGVFLYQAALPVGLLATVVGAYWCITKLGLQRFLLLSFAGLLAAAQFTYREANPWKYGLALPVSMLVILVFARSRALLCLVVTPLLAAVSIAAEFRSWIAILAIATLLVALPRSSQKPTSTSRIAWLGFVVMMVGGATAWLITRAATAGLLGEYLERRTNSQLQASNGNLLLGGRPEWGAAIALWRENPLGIGIGVAPSYDDYWLAILSMPLVSRGLQEISTVAESFQQGVVNFHSTFWTFWGVYGVAGLASCILALAYFAHASMLAGAKLGTNVQAAVVLLMLSSIWDLLFSPTVIAQLAIALATALHIFVDPNVVEIQSKEFKDEKSSIN